MQTKFSPAQLADAHMRESERILRTCVHCGFCTATCPTYLLLGDELDSPRGRIYLIKDMLENGKPASADVVRHVDRCLSCLSCMTTCPSGVHYMHLVDHARAHIEKTYKRPWHDRLLRATLAHLLPYPARFRAALIAARLAKPLAPVLKRLPVVGEWLGAMLSLAPSSLPAKMAQPQPSTEKSRARVAILEGCAQSVLDPGINARARNLLARFGVEVVAAPGEGCCGALGHHLGKESSALDFARRNVDAWTALMESAGLDAILITASGCGTTVKDYGFMLREDAAYAEKAKRISALAKDISEYLAALDLPRGGQAPALKIAYHSACSLQHGQQIRDEPKKLLRNAGFEVRDIPEGHICCGSAGTYNMLQPQIAAQLRDRKLANIAKLAPDVIAAGNIGCMTQLGSAAQAPVVHTVELLDWAYGGAPPAKLTGKTGN
ncbi:MAG: glycolate oxidase subunit GlcF [Alphaproteobacteria bacterium]|nr:glycolate oxidase subunit GlcF [Alphaproteobacteria bacterium]